MTVTLMKMEDMSLQHWIKEALLPLKWVEKVQNVSLVYSPERARYEAQIVWLPNFLDEGRGWVYFDTVDSQSCVLNSVPTTEQTTRITVYNESSSIISPSYYTINYPDGAILINGGGLVTPDGTPTKVDFTQHYVSVVDGWPGTEPPDPPIVAIQTENFDKQPFQLGGGRKSVRRFSINIFATSSAERDDLTEFLYDSMYNRHIPVLDFRSGEPLKYDGTYNTTYSGTLLQLSPNDDSLFYFRNVRAEYINARPDWSDLNRWRSRLTFTTESYRDAQDFNVL
jgi:hypothetical protein